MTNSTDDATSHDQTRPFPEPKWRGFTLRMTKACRDFTKRWKRDRSGFRVDGGATCMVRVVLYMRGDGELVGWTDPKITSFEPRSHDWVAELGLETSR